MGFALSNVEGRHIYTTVYDDDDEGEKEFYPDKKERPRAREGEGDGAKFPINNGGCVACMRDMPAALLRVRTRSNDGLLTQLTCVAARDARKDDEAHFNK